MQMIKVRTCDLIGAALDLMVAIAIGGERKPYRFASNEDAPMHMAWVFPDGYAATSWRPSTEWDQGGRLIDKHIHLIENQSTRSDPDGIAVCLCWCDATQREGEGWGATKLIAACRAIVSAHLGDSVDVPAELVGGGV